MSSGAYGFVMSSNYNSRGRAPEVLVDDDVYFLVRERENFDDLVRGEHLIPLRDSKHSEEIPTELGIVER